MIASAYITLKVVDLTLDVSSAMPVFPGSPKPSFIEWSRFETHGYDSEVMFLSTHTGTHMDAPSHFKKGTASIDKISPSRFVCNAVLVDVVKKANELITVDDIAGCGIHENDTVVLQTGWEKRRASTTYMTSNPGLGKAAAEYLVKKKINAVAIDGPSIDAGKDSKFTVHNILLPNGIVVIENLCNLSKLAKKRFTLIVTPLKLKGASGSPVRAIGILD